MLGDDLLIIYQSFIILFLLLILNFFCMRNHFTLLCAMIVLWLLPSCSNDVVNGVFVPEKQSVEREKSVLTLTLKNLQISEGMVIGILDKSLFDEYGGISTISKSDFLVQQPIKSAKVIFDDLTAYYKSNVYVNVFKVEGDSFIPLTNRTNELKYFVAFGKIEKTIDCGAQASESIKQTTIEVTVPSDYLNKDLFLVQKENQTAFLSSMLTGGVIEEGLYVQKATAQQMSTKLMIDTPLSAKSYVLFLVNPEEGIAYLKQDLREIDYNVTEVECEFQKEQKKKISVSAVRGDAPLDNHEIYLIEASKWPSVEEVVKNQHGHPEAGTYVEKKSIMGGTAVFEVFCTEGAKDYIVYIPKWNTDYYDSFQKMEVTVNSETSNYNLEFNFPYVPPTSGGVLKKVVDLEVTVNNFEGYNFSWEGAFIYVLNDSEKLTAAINSGLSIEGLYKSEQNVINVNGLPVTILIKNVEISSDKEVAIFLSPVFWNYNPMLSIKRESGANITSGFKVTLTKDNLENIPY